MSHHKEEDDLVSPVSPASVVFPVNQPGVPSRMNTIDSLRDGNQTRFQEPFELTRPSPAVRRRDSLQVSPRTSIDTSSQTQFNQYSSRVDSTRTAAQYSESCAPPHFITPDFQQKPNHFQYQQPTAYGDDKPPAAPATRSDSTASTVSPNEPPSKWAYMRQDGWLVEATSLAFSVLCFIGIIIVLVSISGLRVDAWPVFLTPNTLVSLLSTFSKAALLVPVANSIGQLKWLHFEQGRPRRLVDLEVFDRATRGPAGAMSLLFHSGTRSSFAVIGCLVTILALFADPFSQQAINIDTQQVVAPRGTALFSNATVYDSGASVKGQQFTVNPDASMYAAILNGAFTASSSNLGFECSTSKCNWPGSYPFLGVRSTCTNVTHLTLEDCSSPNSNGEFRCNYQTPGNLTINTKTFREQGILRSTALNAVSATELNSREAQLARYAVWKRQNAQNSPWEVTECTLSFAAFYYGNISVIGNKMIVGASVVYPLRGPPGPDFDSAKGKAQALWRFRPNMADSLQDDQSTGDEDGETVSRGPEEWRRGLRPVQMMVGLGDFLEAREILGREIFTANLEEPQPIDAIDTAARGVARTVLAMDDTSVLSKRLARSMTERLRRGGGGGSTLTAQIPTSRGVALEMTNLYTVSWAWVVYLPVLVLGALVLLLATAYLVSRHEAREKKSVGMDVPTEMPRYKHSSVALLLGNVQGFEGSLRVEAAKNTCAGLNKVAEKEWVLKWKDGFVRAGVPET